MRVLVVGGGIGGLTVALGLAQRGHEVTVFEQAAAFGEVGAGIQVSPNCTRVLHELGLEHELRAAACLPEAIQFRHWRNGKVIGQSPLGEDAVRRYGFPYYHMHRADLLDILVQAARGVPNILLRSDARVGCFSQDDARATVSTAVGDHDGEVLLGADGIHSVIRAGLWGDDRPRFTGCIAWRTLVPAAALPLDRVRPMATLWWGPGAHFVHYYVRRGELVNCVGVVEKTGWEVESWTARGELAEFATDFAGWHDDIQRLIDNADSLFKWALHDRAPMPRWGKGRVTLLGDACHPTLPFMAQGAAMAIEDAAVLTACLAGEGDVPTALQRYERLRRDRTADVQRGSRRNATLFHLAGFKAWLRNRATGHVAARTTDDLYRYNAFEAAQSRG